MSRSSVPTALVIFSGLPGTGKSTLARELSIELGWTVLSIDDLVEGGPGEGDWRSVAFWDVAILRLLEQADDVLRTGEGVIVDSVFMNRDRFHARAIADEHAVPFRPIHTSISDEVLWRHRVTTRFLMSDPVDGVATWQQVKRQRDSYRVWEPGTALFVDGVMPLAHNRRIVLEYVSDPDAPVVPLADISFAPGDYHH